MRKTAALVYSLFALIPLLWVVLSSLKRSADLFSAPWSLPREPHWQNYGAAWTQEGLGQGFFNSLVVCALTLVILLPVGAMAAYVLAKFRFRGRGVVRAVFLGGMLFPNFLTVIPLYFLLVSLGWVNTLHGIVVAYVAYSLSFTVFVLGGFFEAIPGELAEAAEIDGCSENAIFWKIMWPLAKPGLFVVGLFNAIGLWNEYPLAVILLNDPSTRTLPLKIADMAMSQQYQSNWGHLFAGLVLSMAPVLIAYFLYRERIHQALLAGALKG